MTKYFPIKKELRIEKIEYMGEVYVRTKEVASFLGVKQPFEFNGDIRRWNGAVILKGQATENFRGQDDEARTTFITIRDMVRFLEQGTINHKISWEYKNAVLDVFMNELGW